MENGVWKGITYSAFDIAKKYNLEKQIRQASGRKELRCLDTNCVNPELKYCHGEKKGAYFAHISNCSCDYNKFDKENTPFLRQINRSLYDVLISKGYNVQIETKIIPHHYSHMLVTLPNQKQVAIELGTEKTTANKISYIASQYENIGIGIKWIVVMNSALPTRDEDSIFLKRHALNETNKKDVLMIDARNNELIQYTIDSNLYEYNGFNMPPKLFSDMYVEKGVISQLEFENDELTIPGFYDRSNSWLEDKQKEFNKEIALLKEEACRVVEERRALKKNIKSGYYHCRLEMQDNKQTEIKKSYAECYDEVKDKFTQQKTPILDSTGVRWIMCENCGAIKPKGKFVLYGGLNHVNLGTCSDCKNNDLQQQLDGVNKTSI